jgi:hypothetical protein
MESDCVPYERRKVPHGILAKDVLTYLAMGAALYLSCSSPNGARRFLKSMKKEWNRRNARLVLDRLQKHKLISYHQKDATTLIVTITQAGKRKVKEWELEHMKIEVPRKWDKRWRIVTFDIREDRKKGRDALREMLKQLNFYQLQRSVFVHPYSCKAEIELICDVFRLPAREVLYFSTDRVPCEDLLKKKFKL